MGKAMRYSSTVLVVIWYCILLVPNFLFFYNKRGALATGWLIIF
jgi:hypothetical protein